jgi:GT2 family glycosyltransferase
MSDLASFRDVHRGGSILVCACGESLNTLSNPERFVTIGVNDVGRKFNPNYLVVVDPRDAFKADRFHYVETSRAGVFFTQRTDLEIEHPNIVHFRLGTKDGTDFSDPGALNYSVTTPYVALSLAVHMGAANVGLIGIDFTDNHFFGATGTHAWAPYVDTVDAQFDRLCRAALARGVRVFNLSVKSRLTSVPKLDLETFASLDARRPGQVSSRHPLRIVSYATTPLVGVPATLAHCINVCTPHYARCVWVGDTYANGITFDGDISWTDSPARAMAELESADVVVVHNGKVDERHRAVLAGKPVVTMAHNYMSNVDDGFVRRGFPGLVVGQYQATLQEFAGWSMVPNPVAPWRDAYEPSARNDEVTIAFTPSGKYGVYPRDHPLYWHGKGYEKTIRILDGLAARHPIRLEIPRDRFVSHAEAMRMKRRAHILIDECVTGSYHRNSLEGLASGCVVVNGVGSLPGVAEALRHCAGHDADNPFVRADLNCLESILELLIGLGPAQLAEDGAANRAWLERHWDFARQWHRFWQPAIDDAVLTAAIRAASGRVTAQLSSASEPDISVVICSLNEGPLLRRTVDSFAASLPVNGEIIVIDDGSTDGSVGFLNQRRDHVTLLRPGSRLGISKARNLGARQARGRIVVFSDAHMAVPRDWPEQVAVSLADPDVGAVGPAIRAMRFPEDYDTGTSASSQEPRGFGMKWSGPALRTTWLPKKRSEPYDVPLLCGAFIAMRRNVFAAIGGFDPGLDAGGLEDAELSFRLWTLGYRCLVLPAIDAAHFFRAERPYPIGSEQVLYNKLRLATLHFRAERRLRVIDTMRGHAALAEALARLETDGTNRRRDRLRSLNRHDDDWFFRRFGDEPMPELSDAYRVRLCDDGPRDEPVASVA